MADEEDKLPSIRDRLEEALNEAGSEPEEQQQERAPPPPRRRLDLDEPERDELSEGIEKPPGERPRDEHGRFIKEEDAQPEAQPKPEAKQPEEPKPEAPEAETPADQKREPESRDARVARMTANWSQDHKEFLGKQPPDVQDFLLDRTGEMDRAYFRKTQNLSGFINEYGPIHQMLEPDLPAIQAAGYTPRMLIEGWANCERSLLAGPQQAAMTLRTIAEGYKVPRETIAAAFGFDPRTPDQILGGQPAPVGGDPHIPATNGAGYADVPFRDPRVDMILAERQEQQERATIAYNQQIRAAANNAMAQINQFREARDARGNLLHPHFAEVEAHMTALAEFYGKRDGKLPSLDALYTDAVNANPVTRAKALADAQRAQSERQRSAEAARGKTEQARKAASSVVGSGRPTSRTPDKALPRGSSVRAHIDAAFNEVAGED